MGNPTVSSAGHHGDEAIRAALLLIAQAAMLLRQYLDRAGGAGALTPQERALLDALADLGPDTAPTISASLVTHQGTPVPSAQSSSSQADDMFAPYVRARDCFKDAQWEVVYRLYGKGMSVRETAKKLGISERAVRGRRRRALCAKRAWERALRKEQFDLARQNVTS